MSVAEMAVDCQMNWNTAIHGAWVKYQDRFLINVMSARRLRYDMRSMICCILTYTFKD